MLARDELLNHTHEIPLQERLLKALGHQISLLHGNTDTGVLQLFCLLPTRRLRKAKIRIFQAVLAIPNMSQNKSGGQGLNTLPQQFCLLS